jgi:ABC-type glycerol-3-phosphate transport system permease component
VAVAPWNNLFLIVIVIWLQAGFAMVLVFGGAERHSRGTSGSGRIDGANEFQIFFRIMIPYIRGTIITVWTTVVIFTLKIFDVVWVMTGGQFGTHVIATQFYRQSFTNRNSGLWFSHCHCAADRGHPGDDTTTCGSSGNRRHSKMESGKRQKLLGSLFVNGPSAARCTMDDPTLGIFVSSFRNRNDIATSGWWNVLPHREWQHVREIDISELGLGPQRGHGDRRA